MCDSNVPNPCLAQELNRELTRAGRSTGKKCHKLRKLKWSVKLAKARHKVSILKRVIGMTKLHKNFHPQIQKLQSSGGTDFLIPDNIDGCKKALRIAQREVWEIFRESARHRKEEIEERLY
jgi:hypothetical protein